MSNSNNQPHVVCVPLPKQGHLNPMLKLAKLLHRRGFHVTFVHTEYSFRRLLKSRAPETAALTGLPGFRIETIPDGLPAPAEADTAQDIPSLLDSVAKTCLDPFRRLLKRLNDEVPAVSCVVSDSVMTFSVEAAEELGIPVALFWTASACGLMGYMQFPHLIHKGLTPLKDESQLTNGYLDTIIDWIPGLNDIRLKHLPTFIRTTDRNDIMLNVFLRVCATSPRATATFLNTFDALEPDVLQALSAMLPRIITIGPLHLLEQKTRSETDPLASVEANLWTEQPECLQWLDTKEDASVLYVNFGSVAVVTPQQLEEFAWGLANSEKPFLWIIRPDLVAGDGAVILPPGFVEATRERGMISGWCAQEEVLGHRAVGGFLTHCGWNSVIESLVAGVAVACWPFFAEQPMNCRFLCRDWGVGMEIEGEVGREGVERVVRELMEGEMRKKASEWKRRAEEATDPFGSSVVGLDELANEVLLRRVKDHT